MKRTDFKNYLMELPNFIFLFVLSFFLMLASPILVDISTYFDVSPENMNIITTLFLIGQAGGILSLNLLNKKFNSNYVVIWAYLLLILALTGLIISMTLVFFYILYFVSGLFFGIIFINTNTSMLEGKVKNKNSVVSVGFSFFAIGALVSPFISSSLINRQIGWKLLYLPAIGLVVISFISFLFKNKRNQIDKDPFIQEKIVPLKKLFDNKNIIIYLIITIISHLFYVMSETIVYSWTPTFFRIEKFFDLYSASLMISLFWVGILIGRLSVSFLSYKFKSGILLIALSIISLLGLSLLIFPTIPKINFIGIVITGLGFSGIPPLLISSAGRILGPGNYLALTVLFTTGIASGSLVPFIVKFVANYNFFISMVIPFVFMVIITVFIVIRKYYRKTIKKSES